MHIETYYYSYEYVVVLLLMLTLLRMIEELQEMSSVILLQDMIVEYIKNQYIGQLMEREVGELLIVLKYQMA